MQLYQYPAKRWKRKKRILPDPQTNPDGTLMQPEMHQINTIENPAVMAADASMMKEDHDPNREGAGWYV